MIDWGTLVPLIFGIISTIVGGVAVRDRARLRILLNKSELELQRVENEGTQFEQLMKFINSQAETNKQQIGVNRTFAVALDKVAQANEQNYQVLKQLWDRQTQEIMENSRRTGARVEEKIDELPAKIAAIALEGLKTITVEMAVQMAEIVREAIGHRDMVAFPTLRDVRWQRKQISPKNGVACLFDQPRYSELAKLITPEACIKQPEMAYVIEEAAAGFHAIRRENGTYGWLPDVAINVLDITQEVQGERFSSTDNASSGGSSGDGGGRAGRPAAPPTRRDGGAGGYLAAGGSGATGVQPR